MYRRDFVLKTAGVLAAAGLTVTGCTTTSPSANADPAKRRHEIDTNVDSALTRLYTAAPGSRDLVKKAQGVLVFPSVIAAGLWLGGQYGEGALRSGNNASNGYYSTASASIGLQIGAQSKAIFFLFMTPEALNKFRSSKGWAVGADASVAMLKIGANGNIDTSSVTASVLGFVLTNSGLMANLTLEGTKVTRLDI